MLLPSAHTLVVYSQELSKASNGVARLHKGDFHKIDLEEGCPPSKEILSRAPRVPWEGEPHGGACRASSDASFSTLAESPLTIVGLGPVKYGLRFILSWLYKVCFTLVPCAFPRWLIGQLCRLYPEKDPFNGVVCRRTLFTRTFTQRLV